MLSIHLFGRLQLHSNSKAWQFAVRPKTISLLAFLLLNRTHPTKRTALAALLWPDQTEGRARSDLRRHLYDLEQALPMPPPGQSWVLRNSDILQWNPEASYWLDVADFERLCDSSPQHLAKAVSLYTGPLLPQVYEDWLDQERSRLDQLYFSSLRRLIALTGAQGQIEQAVGYAKEALNHDPLLEDVARELMRLYSESGRRTEALQTFQALQHRLQADLGVKPAQETLALFESITNNVPLVAIPLSAHPHPTIQHNLSAPLTSFVGRETVITTLHQILASPLSPVRLLTLVGPPGTGKTRLALEIGQRLLSHQASSFPDGIFFVDLSGTLKADQVPVEIASVLQITPKDNQPLLETLKAQLRGRYILLILDNFEQVLEAALAISELLAAVPQLHILVTSRTPLKLYGEHEFPVQPLALPERDHLLPVNSLRAVESIALFESRACQRQPTFVVTDDNSADVTEICLKLDGLPLAIELAAGLIQSLSPAQMVQQMSNQLSLLTSDLRDRPERQQTLRAAIAWSYDLLAPPEQQLLNELAIFAGGWSLEAARAVCSTVDGDRLPNSLTALAERSLIQPVGEGHERYRMLASIREFALEQLEQEPQGWNVHQRHADYFASLAEVIEAHWYSDQIATLLARLRLEEDNIRAALSWSLPEVAANGEPPLTTQTLAGVRLATATSKYWQVSGRLDEGRAWLERGLNYRQHLPPEQQVRLTGRLSWLMQLQADYDNAKIILEESLAVARKAEDPLLLGKVLHDLGSLAGRMADYPQAERLLVEASALKREVYHEMTNDLALTLNNLAIVYKYLTKFDQASGLLEEMLAYRRESKVEIEIASVLSNLGNLALVLGQHARAESYYREALPLLHALGDQIDLCVLFPGMAELALAQGNPVRSAKLNGFSQAFYKKLNLDPTLKGREQFERVGVALTELLGQRQFEVLFAEGAAMTLDEAVAFALAV